MARPDENEERPSRGRGRQRSSASHRAILAAVESLLGERGYAGTSVEAVAARAGVGKQTIYRWWGSKAELVMEAFAELAERRVPVPDTGSAGDDLVRLLSVAFDVLSATPAGHVVAGLLVEAQSDPEVARAFRDRFVEGRREAVRKIVRRGQDRGQLRPDLDPELVADALYGPLWYRLLVRHGPLDAGFAEGLVRQLLGGIAAGPVAGGPAGDQPISTP